jgi:hypothetical protein
MKDLFNKAKEFYEYGTKGKGEVNVLIKALDQTFTDGVLAGLNLSKHYLNKGASKMATKKPVAKITPKAVVKKVAKPVAKKVTFKARKTIAGVRFHIGTYATKEESEAVLALATTLAKATKLRKDYLKAQKAK